MNHIFINYSELVSTFSLQSIDCSSSSAVNENVLKVFIQQARQCKSRLQRVSMMSCNISSSIPWEVMDELENWKDCRLQLMELSYNDISESDKTQIFSSWCVAVNKMNMGMSCRKGIGNISRRKCRFTVSS